MPAFLARFVTRRVRKTVGTRRAPVGAPEIGCESERADQAQRMDTVLRVAAETSWEKQAGGPQQPRTRLAGSRLLPALPSSVSDHEEFAVVLCIDHSVRTQ